MNPMDSETIRQTFVEYFVRHDHRQLPSASLIPPSDTGSLLTIAGMQQITPFFLGLETPPAPATRHRAEVFPHPGHRGSGRRAPSHFFRDARQFLGRGLLQAGRDRITRTTCLTNGYGIDPTRLYPSIHPDDEEARDVLAREIGFAAGA